MNWFVDDRRVIIGKLTGTNDVYMLGQVINKGCRVVDLDISSNRTYFANVAKFCQTIRPRLNSDC